MTRLFYKQHILTAPTASPVRCWLIQWFRKLGETLSLAIFSNSGNSKSFLIGMFSSSEIRKPLLLVMLGNSTISDTFCSYVHSVIQET